MPELPEVETLRRGLLPLIRNKTLVQLEFLRPDLRFPIPADILKKRFIGSVITDISRIGKYLLLHSSQGAMLLHLGMSGRVTQHASMKPEEPHTHAVFEFEPGTFLHFIDPRRFGCILWVPENGKHKLLDHLGPDPLADSTTASLLKHSARTCKGPIKTFLMNARRLAGIGNIYACEALFEAEISPRRGAHRLTLKSWERLLESLRRTLQKSINSGGTTLRDFYSSDGTPGYYALSLSVYGKEGHPCSRCTNPIRKIVQSGRSTFYCNACQTK